MTPLSEPDDFLAAELALGVLHGDELAAARARLPADSGFAVATAAWAELLSPLLDDIAPVAPPAAILASLLSRTAVPQPANDPLPALHRKVNLWRGATGLATALAASLAVALLLRPATTTLPRPPAPVTQIAPRAAPLVALLGEGTAAPRLLASYDPAARQLVLAATRPLSAGAEHDHELWVIPVGSKPVSLGVLAADARSHRLVPPDLAQLIVPGATLAVSVEPTGGSLTGQPTGALVASGALDRA